LLQQALRGLSPMNLPQQLRNGICRRRSHPSNNEYEYEQ
jgi:hypothetical protein